MRRVLPVIAALALIASTVSADTATLGGDLGVPLPLFPAGNWWNRKLTTWPVDTNSTNLINFINSGHSCNGQPVRCLHPDFGSYSDLGPPPSVATYGFPYAVVSGVTSGDLRTVQFLYSDESDGVDHTTNTSFPFYPIPDAAQTQPYWIEGGDPGDAFSNCNSLPSDRHMLIIDKGQNYLYELYNLCWDRVKKQWHAGSGAFWDMNTNNTRPDGWTSADAAGLQITPGLIRYDEVYNDTTTPIKHAFRFTVRSSNGHVYPASHDGGSTSGALPMGARLRLKASVNLNNVTTDLNAQKIFQAMKDYGLIVADNGSDMYIQGTFDPRWNQGSDPLDTVLLPAFGSLSASDFEVIQLGYNPPASNLSIADSPPVPEGNSGTPNSASFVVTLSPASTDPVTVDYATADGTATAGADYVATTGTLSFAAGVTSATITVPVIGDVLNEDNETFSVTLSNASNAGIATATGHATILDDDPLPSVSIGDTSVTEGDVGVVNALFPVTLDAPSGRTVSVEYSTAPGTATSGVDYVAATGTLTFPEGATSRSIAVQVKGDTTNEADETFDVNLDLATNATITGSLGTGTILNDDTLPTLSIGDVTVTRATAGSTAVLTATLSAAAGAVSVNYATADGSARAGTDYTATAGTLTFAPGASTATLSVPIIGRHINRKFFLVQLDAISGAKLGRSEAQVTLFSGSTARGCISIAAIPYTITSAGHYCLAASASRSLLAGAAITIAASDVDLNLRRHAITNTAGASSQAYGVYAENVQRVTVRNGSLNGFFTGVFLGQAPLLARQSVTGVIVSGSGAFGIHVEGVGNRVSYNTVTTTGGSTVLGADADVIGIFSSGASASVSHNSVSTFAPIGDGAGHGIVVSNADASGISENSISNAAVTQTTGIEADASTGASIRSNVLKNLHYGIVLAGGSTGTVAGNVETGVVVP
jgi:hypothetical protein